MPKKSKKNKKSTKQLEESTNLHNQTPKSNIKQENISELIINMVDSSGKVKPVKLADILNNFESRLEELNKVTKTLRAFRTEMSYTMASLKATMIQIKDSFRAFIVCLPMILPIRKDVFIKLYALCGKKTAIVDDTGKVQGVVEIYEYGKKKE